MPHETNPPPIVDSNAVLAGPFSLQRVEPICRRNSEVIEAVGRIQHSQLSPGKRLNLDRQSM
jgi:hypothetical protein